jgi:orotate phosphoribosyltransferase
MSEGHERLLELLRERSFARKKVVLASGKESDFFIDCKQAVLTAEGHHLVGMLMLEALGELGTVDAVAGVELGGCPLASAVSYSSHPWAWRRCSCCSPRGCSPAAGTRGSK